MPIEKCAGRAARYPAGDQTPVFDHIAVWARDTEATATFLTEVMGWRRHPTVIRVSDEEKTTGGMIGTFFDAPGLWIELIEPTTPGPGEDILAQLGDGALVEINFDMGDAYGAALAGLAARGVEMLSMDGSPLRDGGTIDEGVYDGETIQHPGQRIAYFPTALTRGTTVEYYEVLPDDEGSLIHERDRVWRNETREPGTPYIDHVAIVTDDARRAAAFFTGHMGMTEGAPQDHPDGGSSSVLDANGADDTALWLKLIQPAKNTREAQVLAARGPGHILELGVVVPDEAQFFSRVARAGGQVIDRRGYPVDRLPASGEAWLTPATSRGIPIRIARAPVTEAG